MFKIKDFEAARKKDNSHYERFKTSSLHSLVDLLKREKPRANASEVAAEMKKVPDAKWIKYPNTKNYLLKNFPNLAAIASHPSTSTGPSTPGYSPGKWERTKDVDGNWHQYILQEKGNSCGPACVTIVKTALYPQAKSQLREPEVRGIIALHESSKTNEGISALSPEAVGLHVWKTVGSSRPPLIKTLRGKPFSVNSARAGAPQLDSAGMITELRKCSSKRPGIIGVDWSNGSGHWVVCIGETKDKSRLKFLDPWTGVEYVDNDANGLNQYSGSTGKLSAKDPIFTSE